MKGISVILDGEEALFYWKDGKVYAEGYDLESERVVLALTGFGEGIGVLLVASNDCCKTKTEFVSEVKKFLSVYKKIVSEHYDEWPEGQLLFEYCSYSPDPEIRWGGLERAHLTERHYKRILKDPAVDSKERMARLDKLPEKYFHALLALSLSDINWDLAHNLNCPIDVLEILAQDKDEDVRVTAQESLLMIERLEV